MSIIEDNAPATVRTLTIDQKSDWVDLVNRAVETDFYHSWHYHALAKTGTPLLFVHQERDDFIALPLLKREISKTSYFDLHSVYGYSGPISNFTFANMPSKLTARFKNSFLNFLEAENIVSVFSKMHPFFEQEIVLEQFDGLYDNGKTVAIDLRNPIEIQRKKYRQTTLDSVKKCRKMGFQIKDCSAQEQIAAFTLLYQQNMHRINASEFYLFTEEYFTKLLNTDEYLAKLILVYDGDKIICGSIIMCNNGIIQGHLIATNAQYLRYSPAKFLVDEVSLLGRTIGMSYYHLGGGLGFKENSLFEWKLGFSDLTLNYKSWRYIANPIAYNDLVLQTGNSIDDKVDFFPLYRMSNQ